MLRHIANSNRVPLWTLHRRAASQVTLRRYASAGGADNNNKAPVAPTNVSPTNTPATTPTTTPTTPTTTPKHLTSTSTSTSTSTTPTPKPPTSTPVTTPPNKNNEYKSGSNNQQEKSEGGSGTRVVVLGFLLAALAAGASTFHPYTREKMQEWGVYSTIDGVLANLGLPTISPSSSPSSRTLPVVTEPAVPTPVPAVPVAIEVSSPFTTVPQDAPVAVVPIEDVPAVVEFVPVAVDETEIIPVEISAMAHHDVDLPPSADITPMVVKEASTPEAVLDEIMGELTTPSSSSSTSTSTSEFQALLAAQASQLEEIQAKLQQYYQDSQEARTRAQSDSQAYTSSAKDYDERTRAHEQAYYEALALRERVYKREVEEKLAQLTSDLKVQYEDQHARDHNETRLAFEREFEQKKVELQREMESALKTAIDRAESQYSVKLAEEINKFDTKLSEEMAAEDAKYNASFSERLKTIEKLHNDVSVLETVLLTNAARLKENIQLHNVSAALFELGHTTLSSPVRTSFVAELDRLEAASTALGSGDPVVKAVAEVLRPIAAVGVAPYSELVLRFSTVLASGRQAALVPPGGGVMDNLVALVAAKLIQPAKGPVQGSTPEALLAQAEYHLQHGDLQQAVDQLARLQGLPQSIARDWLASAHDRLLVENSLLALQAHVQVLAHTQAAKDRKHL